MSEPITAHAFRNITDGLADLDIEIQASNDPAFLTTIYRALKPLVEQALALESKAMRKSEGLD